MKSLSTPSRPVAPRRALLEALQAPQPDLVSLAADGREHLSALSSMMASERAPAQLARLLKFYGDLAGMVPNVQAPEIVLELTDHPDGLVSGAALTLAARLSDPRSVELLVDLLNQSDVPRLQPRVRSAILASRYSRSPEVARSLNRHLESSYRDVGVTIDVIETLRFAGQAVNVGPLKKVVAETHDVRIKRVGAAVLQLLEIMTAPDRDDRLMGMIGFPVVSGSFSSSRWALERIVDADLRHLVPRLRSLYAEKGNRWTQTGPGSFKVLYLSALRKLGADLTAEEADLLKEARNP